MRQDAVRKHVFLLRMKTQERNNSENYLGNH